MKYSDELDSAVKSAKTSGDLVSNLLAIDQKYPKKAAIKAQLGVAYIMNGDVKSASIILDNAEKCMNVFTKKDTAYLIYAGLSDVYGKGGQFGQSKKYAEKALRLKIKDSLGVRVNLARAEMGLGDQDKAFELFSAARSDQRVFLNDSDYGELITILVKKEKWDEAIAVYLEKIETLGYAAGDGLGMSALYEKSGKYNKSLSSAAFELWRLYGDGKISQADFDKRLGDVYKATQAKLDGDEKKQFAALLEAQRCMVEGSWREALTILENLKARQGDCFEAYAFFVTESMANTKMSMSELKQFVLLEPYFKTSQSYYFYLWQAMKKGEGTYSFANIRGVLDKILMLGLYTPIAGTTKTEIGRLLGIPEKDRNAIIPDSVISSRLNEYLSTRNDQVLAEICALLSLADNAYTDECVALLRNFKNDGALKDSLKRTGNTKNLLFVRRISDIFG